MRCLLWIGVLFLSASWLFFIPQFTHPDLLPGSILVLLGVFCIIGGLGRTTPSPLQLSYVLLLLPLIPVTVLVPFPYNLGLMLLAIGLLLQVPFSKTTRIHAIPFGVLLSGVILMVQTIVFPFFQSFASHGHRIDQISPIVSLSANLLGMHTSTNNGILFVQTLQQTTPVTITWEKLGCYLAFNIALGALLLFLLFSEKRKIPKHILIFLCTISLYLLLRFIGVLSFYFVTTDLSVFWDPVLMALTFLPLTLLLMKLLPFPPHEEKTLHLPLLQLTKKDLSALLVMFLLMVSLLGAFFCPDTGSMKQGRVLIDEYHSQWEDTLRPLDTEWYGLLSTYNYYSWARWLEYSYTVTTNTNQLLTSDLLDDYDILILKCPTESYTIREIQSIRLFVEHGGGLYLIGDHTNVFGMNTFLNQVSEQFGIRYKTDATYELGTGDLSISSTDSFWAHPVMRHVPEFHFMTSCTLEPTSLVAAIRMENIIIGNRVISEPGTYSTENFFRESIASPDTEYGYLLQAAAIKHGAGRVVAFTDSTVFSSFCLFTDGYPSFTLGVLGYLNRTNSSVPLPFVFLSIALLCLLTFFVLQRNTKKIKILWVFLFAGLLAFTIVTPVCFSLNESPSPLAIPSLKYKTVCFDMEHSSINISLKPTIALSNEKNNFGTFFVWTQRIGCVPSLQKTLKDAIAAGNIIIMINPTHPFIESDIERLSTYLEAGGKVLLMDSIMNTASTANELLGSFGLWLTTNIVDQTVFVNSSHDSNDTGIGNITSPYLSIVGGEPLLNTDRNETSACIIEFTNTTNGNIGKLLVVVDSYTFSDVLMGGVFTEPSERQRRIYATEFFLFNELLKD